VHTADGADLPRIFLAIVTNTSPWTYLGSRPLTPTPLASFDSGLDLFGMTAFHMVPVVRSVVRLLARSDRVADERWSVSRHDLCEFALSAGHPVEPWRPASVDTSRPVGRPPRPNRPERRPRRPP
jgi:hypothetical protein